MASLILAIALIAGGLFVLPEFNFSATRQQANGLQLRLMEEEVEFASSRQHTIRLQQQAQVYKTRTLYTAPTKRVSHPDHQTPGHLKVLHHSANSRVRAPPVSA